MAEEKKTWIVAYSHNDGRSGVVEVTTSVADSGAFHYGNGKAGLLTVKGEQPVGYDLRYWRVKDLHRAMLDDYFGKGLVSADETSR